MKNIFSSLSLALESFRAHKVRTSLAVLGVTIGIASIIIVFSAGEGIKSLLRDQVESFGAETIQVEIKVPTSKTGFAGEQQNIASLFSGGQVTTLSLKDLEDILKLPNIRDGYGMSYTQESVSYRNEIHHALIWASGASFVNIDRTRVADGRFFSDIEDRSLAQVAVLGAGINKKLFGDDDPLDKTIKIRDTRFRIIGVMEERGTITGIDFDDLIYVPVRTMNKRVTGADYLTNIIVQVDDMSVIDNTVEDMRVLLRENHNIEAPEGFEYSIFDTGRDDFRVGSMVEAIEIFDDVFATLTLVLLSIVAVSLVVGGVGIMNVMYVIVNEKTPEIGLRKAVGAKYSDIMSQFLVESVLVTLVGGVVGSILGVLMSYGIALGANSAGFVWEFSIPLVAFITAFLFSIVFGVLFGLYPARKAALMNPIEALQYNK
jgi:putative ABC transport system permease protein